MFILCSSLNLQWILKVFRPLDFFKILLHYSLILKWIKLFFSPLVNLHTVPHNDKAKTCFSIFWSVHNDASHDRWLVLWRRRMPEGRSRSRSRRDSRFSSRISLYLAPFIFPLILTHLPVPAASKKSRQHDGATTMLHRRDGARFPPDMILGIQAKEFNLGFIRPEHLVSHGLRVI